MVKNLVRGVLDLLFPRICLGCGEVPKILPRDEFLMCERCLCALTPLSEFICSSCGRRTADFGLCHRGALPIFPAFLYSDEPARSAIQSLKYGQVEKAGEILGTLLWESLKTHSFFKVENQKTPVGLIPVPITRTKERERGFNQSEIIGETIMKLAQKSGASVSWYPHALIKTRETISQTTYHTRESRKENIKGAFLKNEKIHIPEKLLFIIDDVSTSGATLEEAASALRKEGNRYLAGLVIAKA